ncbi:prolyl oligopeptidase family serine peptidase [Bradyrhizobium sp. 44]|jgi:polyhydroxybutyrate depolymerase|uniref:extracellular catalytic domain type 1 short-chain-length polyhydroxyalkanoate depolymerase n=1 Tax=unclassified Bradyrhizobium TaxID=2631580 RepID=UPI001FF982FE|nr:MULTISPECIES: PHB depolymerase family esterase [unclassified Bradyrhizobium]MCK1285273.1 prolyl oligopeptidase family serine peptidase [Bradyrhizobium sp. 44]MCK1297668.1 prolyl oligopeptidase family serine peptidase [Bradyrhizobium sp. 37]MCK1403448.1 prolyl oligopeptidase family serine peptidase [Bradyrhizobium sp. 39]MCK1409571.1 prolyl oligopeptidase family serine peptidase [Bradyrhizobium sp. 76]MCK1746643.1 prolyl oligopeptidase family serine peptidase [Bradyrhizobium sp. 135]
MMRRRTRIAAFVAALAATSAASADTIDIDGVKRSYTVQLPTKRLVPLVVVLHGKTQRGADMMTRTAWPQVAKREGFAVVFPDGLNHAWADARTKAGPALRGPPAGTDDVAFIAKLVEKLVASGTADPRRVYVTGISNGGAMAMTLVCARADLFAAGASVSMNLTDEAAVTCHPSRPLPMLLMNGTADPLVPYEGGRGSSYYAADGFWSTDETLAFWRKLNGCETDNADATDLPDRAPADQSTVTRISSRCPGGHDVVLYRINQGGHRMPGFSPDARFPKVAASLLGSQNGDIDAAETIWTFFGQFP